MQAHSQGSSGLTAFVLEPSRCVLPLLATVPAEHSGRISLLVWIVPRVLCSASTLHDILWLALLSVWIAGGITGPWLRKQ